MNQNAQKITRGDLRYGRSHPDPSAKRFDESLVRSRFCALFARSAPRVRQYYIGLSPEAYRPAKELALNNLPHGRVDA